MYRGEQVILWRNKDTDELTYRAQELVHFFQRKGWGNLLIVGKAHFFHTCTTQIRLSTPKLEFSKPFPFLRHREKEIWTKAYF